MMQASGQHYKCTRSRGYNSATAEDNNKPTTAHDKGSNHPHLLLWPNNKHKRGNNHTSQWKHQNEQIRISLYNWQKILNQQNTKNEDITDYIVKSAEKDLPPTNPGFALYRALRASSSTIIRTKHHHTFLSSCLEREFTPRGLSL